MATIDLGKIKIMWKGTYAGGTAYTPDDAVVHNGTSYICIANTTGNTPPNGTYWNVLAQAGTDGTDVGTTLTTQGDILYRDGSGLQRLAAGTNGYYLKTQGSGANPTWAELSGGDLVKVAEHTQSSATNSITIDNCFTNTYRNYIIFLDNMRMSVNNNWLGFKFRTGGASGSDDTGSNYCWVGQYAYQNNSSNAGSTTGGWNQSNGYVFNLDISSTGHYPSAYVQKIFTPHIAHNTVCGSEIFLNHANFSAVQTGDSTTIVNNNNVYTGIKYYAQTGSTTISVDSKISVYGIK